MSEKDAEDRSFILIEFEEFGSVLSNMQLQNVTPLQLLAAASYLEFEGKNNLAVQKAAQMQYEMQKRQSQQLIIPGSEGIITAK